MTTGFLTNSIFLGAGALRTAAEMVIAAPTGPHGYAAELGSAAEQLSGVAAALHGGKIPPDLKGDLDFIADGEIDSMIRCFRLADVATILERGVPADSYRKAADAVAMESGVRIPLEKAQNGMAHWFQRVAVRSREQEWLADIQERTIAELIQLVRVGTIDASLKALEELRRREGNEIILNLLEDSGEVSLRFEFQKNIYLFLMGHFDEFSGDPRALYLIAYGGERPSKAALRLLIERKKWGWVMKLGDIALNPDIREAAREARPNRRN